MEVKRAISLCLAGAQRIEAEAGLGMHEIVELSEDELRRKNNAKWGLSESNVIPASIAEMDFAIAPPIQTAITRLVADQDYGYPVRARAPAELVLGQAFARRMQARFGWKVDADRVVAVTNLVQASFASVVAFSEPGDGVALQLPAYPPVHMSINDTKRRLVPMRMRFQNGRYAIDLDEITASPDAQTRILMICNPHNPTGRVFDRDELLRLGTIAVERDMVIVSDEIYADMTFDGRRHIPIGSLGPEIAERTVTLNSAGKSFNIPGLRCAVMHFGSAALQARFHAVLPPFLLGAPSVFGIMATLAAWDEGQPWLDAAVRKLQSARDHLAARLRAEMPAARFMLPEATSLAWIDFSALGLKESAYDHFMTRNVGLSPGEKFDSSCRAFARLNFATSIPILDRIIDAMAGAPAR
jgi:cystathionine beta-lyase